MTTTVVFCLQEAVASVDAHRQKGGSGAVGDITQMPSGKVVTGGADGHVAVLDPRRGYQVVARIPVGDFVYSLASVGAFIICISVWAIVLTCFVKLLQARWFWLGLARVICTSSTWTTGRHRG